MMPITEKIELLKLASGDCLWLQVYRFIGQQPGKKVYLQANLHGAEIVGNVVLYQLIEFLSTLESEQIQGEICLLPVCNPLATNQRHHFFSTGRFNSYDGKDWNRIFWDYSKVCQDLEIFARSQLNLSTEEIKKNYRQKILLAWQEEKAKINLSQGVPIYKQLRSCLQSLCLDSDYVIDIHSSSNQAIDYLYCFHGREKSAAYFLLDYGIFMGENQYDGDAFDEAFIKPWLALEKTLTVLGKKTLFDLESWTLELGSGMQIQPESVTKGVLGIKNYLIYKGILNLDIVIQGNPLELVAKDQIDNYYGTTGGMVQKKIKLGEKVKKGDRLYQIISFNKEKNIPQPIDIFARRDGLVFDVSNNNAVNQGEYILGIMPYEK